ncbi:MAG: hypothetical protein PHS14_08260 [Elusimicrobia bacterium]|nr:hypothetical protein [Elusimicrobiota bacterium]
MMFEVELKLSCIVEMDSISADAAKALAVDKVANGPCLFVAEGTVTGAHKKAGYYLVKGMSAEVIDAWPFLGNRRVNRAPQNNADEEEGVTR